MNFSGWSNREFALYMAMLCRQFRDKAISDARVYHSDVGRAIAVKHARQNNSQMLYWLRKMSAAQ